MAELLADGLGGAGDKPAHEQLSEREFQVFLRLAKGETIGHMADSMSLSVKTVSTYRTRVMEKMKRRVEQRPDLLRAEERADPVARRVTPARVHAAGPSALSAPWPVSPSARRAQYRISASISFDLSNTRSAPSSRHLRRMSGVA